MKKSLALIVLCVDYMLLCTYRSSTRSEMRKEFKEEITTYVLLYCAVSCENVFFIIEKVKNSLYILSEKF
jgi:hypothetical protein